MSTKDFGRLILSVHRNHTIITTSRIRHFCAVKELSWCAPKDSPNKRRQSNDNTGNHIKTANLKNENKNESLLPIPIISKFGIVAAMDVKTRIIGIDNKLPWNIPEDRTYFKALTKRRILIIGRNTLYECNQSLIHVAHARKCIVISTTLTTDDIKDLVRVHNTKQTSLQIHSNFISIARSLAEALQLAHTITMDDVKVVEKDVENDDDKERAVNPKLVHEHWDYDCWIAGGERVYDEAVQHKSARVIHLTLVEEINDKKNNDVLPGNKAVNKISVTNVQNDSNSGNAIKNERIPIVVRKFPAKYRWDHKFKQVHELGKQQSQFNPSVYFQHVVYTRIQ